MNRYELRNVKSVDEEQKVGKNRVEGIRIENGTPESKSVVSAFSSLVDYTVST